MKAATSCFVTQPTLSAMIQKLEDELDIKIFDRSAQPVIPTECGKEIVAQAKTILEHSAALKEIAHNSKNIIVGTLNVGVIPTAAIYLLPVLAEIATAYPAMQLNVQEQTTAVILEKLKSGALDSGIIATPVEAEGIFIEALFLEPLKVYSASKSSSGKYVLPSKIKPQKVWMLEEAHCLSKQFANICNLKADEQNILNKQFKTGSLETLIRLVEQHHGVTVIPEIAASHLLDKSKRENIKSFKAPVPVRQMSLVTHRPFVKARLNNFLKTQLLEKLQPMLPKKLKAEHYFIVEA